MIRSLNIKKAFPVRRRFFLQGALGAGMMGQSVFSFGRHQIAAKPGRAVYQDMPYIDFSGHGGHYTPPRGNASTRKYLKSLTRDQKLNLQYWY